MSRVIEKVFTEQQNVTQYSNTLLMWGKSFFIFQKNERKII